MLTQSCYSFLNVVKKAYENWHEVIEYDGKALLNSKQSRRTRSSHNETPMTAISYPNASIDGQLTIPRLPIPTLAEQQLVDNTLARPGIIVELIAM